MTAGDRPLKELGQWDEMGDDTRAALLGRGRAAVFDPDLRKSVREIIEGVRADGDEAVAAALRRFDGCDVPADRLMVTDAEFRAARESVEPALVTAIKDAIDHVRRFNEQIAARGDWSFESEPGLHVGEKVSPIASAGLFVPSGKGSYPSVLIQLATPAVVAGVPEITVAVPPVPGSPGTVDPAVLVAADELGIRSVFRCNGPAGIAAMAFGTATVPKSVKIVGPGSPPVTCAQLEVQRFGVVTCVLLGASESLIVADDSADPRLLAADLLNEAEHGPDSSSVLVTDDAALLDRVQAELRTQAALLPEPRRAYALQALGVNGGAVLVRDLAQAAEVANRYAPEHMQIAVRDPDRLLGLLHDAGEILVGQWTPISAANFVIGCPAALPTAGFAKVNGGVTVEAFRKRTAVARADRSALSRMRATAVTLARHEGFPAHAAAIDARFPEERHAD